MEKKYIKIKGQSRPVMIDGESNEGAYTPQNALLLKLEEHRGVHRMCIDYLDKKMDEVRNEK